MADVRVTQAMLAKLSESGIDFTPIPDPLDLLDNMIGFKIGIALPSLSQAGNEASVKINNIYDGGTITQSNISIQVPLDVSRASIISPIKNGVRHNLQLGEVGLVSTDNIFNPSGAADLKIQNYVEFDKDGTGYLHVKVPVLLLKREQGS